MRTVVKIVRDNAPLVLAGLAAELLWIWACFFPSGAAGARFLLGDPLIDQPLPWPVFAALVPYAAAWLLARRDARPGRRAVVIAFSLLFAATAIARVHPLATHDLYYYAFAGSVPFTHGANPYLVVPAAYPNDPYARLAGPTIAGWRHVYGPFWTALAIAASALFHGDLVAELLALKLLAVAFFFASVPLVLALRRTVLPGARDADDGALLLFAWNPLLLFETAQNGHNDAMMLCFLLLAVLLSSRRRPAAAGLALAASVMTKYVTALAAPLLALMFLAGVPRRKGARDAAAFAFAFVVACALLLAPFWAGPATFAGAATQARRFSTLYAGPVGLAAAVAVAAATGWPADARFLGTVGALSAAALLAAFAWILVRTARRGAGARPVLEGTALALAAYLACTGFVLPWYVVWWFSPLLVALGLDLEVFVVSIAAAWLYGAYGSLVLSAAAGAAIALRVRRARPAP